MHTVSTGTFFCPRCNGDREYQLRGARRWFTLFFIPIFPVSGSVNPHVHCTTCQGNFAENVLNLPTTGVLRDLQGRAFKQCAVAVLKSGDATSTLARECTVRLVAERDADDATFDDAALDRELATSDPSQLAVYASPIAQRLNDRGCEQFFAGCAQVALADGPLTLGERDALRNLGESLNLSAAHQTGVIETLRAPSEATIEGPGDPTS
jgi:hypothetical protein